MAQISFTPIAGSGGGGGGGGVVTIDGDVAGYAPGYTGPPASATAGAVFDPSGNLAVRGPILTDEGTFRVNFANASLAVSIGSVTVSGDTVTGTGFLTADVHYHDFFKLDADAETAWAQIEEIVSDTELRISAAYTGGASGAASRSLVIPVTGAGGSYSVASSALTMNSGTTSGGGVIIGRIVDCGPIIFRAGLSISQRIANNETRFGFAEPVTVTSPRWFARFNATGTTNTTIICETARNPTVAPTGAEIQQTTVTLPNGATTAQSLEYRIEQLTEEVRFYIAGVLVARHGRVMPAQYDVMTANVRTVNTAVPASSTAVVVDYMTVKNHNRLEIGIMSDAEQVVAVPTAQQAFNYNVAGVIAINTDLLVIDCSQLRGLAIQCTSMGTTGIVTPAFSNDGVNWVAATLVTTAGASAGTFSAAGLWTTPVYARYFRLRLTTATTAGATTLFVTGFQQSVGQPAAQPVSGTVTANIGTGSIAAGTNAIGDVGVQYRANATGAASVVSLMSPATPAVATVKAGAGRLIGWQLQNSSAAVRSVKVFNATAPTLGTTAAVFEIDIPAGGRTEVQLPGGIGFATAITCSVTSAKGLTDNTATGLALNDVSGAFFFA